MHEAKQLYLKGAIYPHRNAQHVSLIPWQADSSMSPLTLIIYTCPISAIEDLIGIPRQNLQLQYKWNKQICV